MKLSTVEFPYWLTFFSFPVQLQLLSLHSSSLVPVSLLYLLRSDLISKSTYDTSCSLRLFWKKFNKLKKRKKKKKRGSFFFDRDVGLQHPNVSEVELYEDNFSRKSWDQFLMRFPEWKFMESLEIIDKFYSRFSVIFLNLAEMFLYLHI